MIGKLRGKVDSVGRDWVIVDVGGVGYEVSCPARALSRMPAIGQPVTLMIETYVREDAIKLFGFLSDAERSWFRLLQNVQGVGTKVALSVLGVLEPHELANAIALQDKAQVGRAPGLRPCNESWGRRRRQGGCRRLSHALDFPDGKARHAVASLRYRQGHHLHLPPARSDSRTIANSHEKPRH